MPRGGARPGSGRPKGSKNRPAEERAERDRVHYLANRERFREQRRAYYQTHLLEQRERDRKKYLANRAKILKRAKERYAANPEYFKKYYLANKEKSLEYTKIWKMAHPDKVREYKARRPEYQARYRQKDPERTRALEKLRYDRQRDNLTDGYVRARLRVPAIGLKARDIPQEMVVAARILLKLKMKLPELPVIRPQFVCLCCGTLYEPKWYRLGGKHTGQGTHYCSRECAFTDIRNWQNRKYQYRPATSKEKPHE